MFELDLVMIPSLGNRVLLSYTDGETNGRMVAPVSGLFGFNPEPIPPLLTGQPDVEDMVSKKFRSLDDFRQKMTDKNHSLWVMSDYSVPIKQDNLKWPVLSPAGFSIHIEGSILPSYEFGCYFFAIEDQDEKEEIRKEIVIGRGLLAYIRMLLKIRDNAPFEKILEIQREIQEHYEIFREFPK